MTADDLTSRRRFQIAVLLLALVVIGGTLGFHFVEGWSLLDSFYIVVISVTTVGFGLIDELSAAGTVLTIAVVLLGFLAGVYGIAAIAEYLIEGHFAGTIKRRRMERLISRLSEHYIVCGFGRTGQGVVNELLREGESVCVVELDPNRAAFAEAMGLVVVRGDSTEDRTLIAAGISRAKGLVAALSSDSQNAFVTLSGRTLAPEIKIVARAESESSRDKLRRVGADYAVTPYDAGAQQMTYLLTRPLLAEVLAMLSDELTGKVVLREVRVTLDSPIKGRSIGDLRRADPAVNVIAIKRAGEEVRCMPLQDEVVADGDQIVVVGTPLDLDQLSGTQRVGAR